MIRLLPRRRKLLALVVTFLLLATGAVVWKVAGGPPLRLVLRYGLPSDATPRATVEIEGVEFVEWGPGYRRVGSHEGCEKGDLLGRLTARFGLSFGTATVHKGSCCPPTWVEVPYRFRIARETVTAGQYWSLVAPDRRWRHELGTGKETFRGRAEEYLARLNERSGEFFRLPRMNELVFAGVPCSHWFAPWHPGFTPNHAKEWYGEMPEAPFRGRQRPFRPVLGPPGE